MKEIKNVKFTFRAALSTEGLGDGGGDGWEELVALRDGCFTPGQQQRLYHGRKKEPMRRLSSILPEGRKVNSQNRSHLPETIL